MNKVSVESGGRGIVLDYANGAQDCHDTLSGALIADGIVGEDRKHTEPRESRDAVAKCLCQNQTGARWKPMMRSVMRKTNNGVVGPTFMYEVNYSLNVKI
jgi:hypothetical protein